MRATKTMDVYAEIAEIGKLMDSARLIMAVRQEVSRVLNNAVVTNGEHHELGSEWDVVVRCGDLEGVTRRLSSEMPNIEVERLAEGVLGVRHARRGG